LEITSGKHPNERIFHNENQPQDFLIDACYSAKIERKKAATFPAYDHRNL
jgi:hypothetical protein